MTVMLVEEKSRPTRDLTEPEKETAKKGHANISLILKEEGALEC